MQISKTSKIFHKKNSERQSYPITDYPSTMIYKKQKIKFDLLHNNNINKLHELTIENVKDQNVENDQIINIPPQKNFPNFRIRSISISKFQFPNINIKAQLNKDTPMNQLKMHETTRKFEIIPPSPIQLNHNNYKNFKGNIQQINNALKLNSSKFQQRKSNQKLFHHIYQIGLILQRIHSITKAIKNLHLKI